MKKVRIGVVGAYRGSSMINYCKYSDNAEVVAICDNNLEVLNYQKNACCEYNITFYDNFEDFIKHDMDAVVLANYANEHAPFAIRAMKAGKHVFSEVLPVETMKEAVELIEAVEETGKIYAYGENYCYMPAPYEIKKLYDEGKIGEFEYGECEYIHNCEPIWPSITYGEKEHWRNRMYSTFYCTHSLGPIIHITGLRPVSVVGFEGTKTERALRVGAMGGSYGIEMVTLENGGLIKSIHGCFLYGNSVWYSVYGSKGSVESGRESAGNENRNRLLLKYDEFSGEYADRPTEDYFPKQELDEKAESFGHDGSDFYAMWHFIEKINGNPKADIIDVYEAMDMFLPGIFAYRSVLNGNASYKIPNLRNIDEREAWRNDTACVSPQKAGNMLLPTSSRGTPEIEDGIYERVKHIWKEESEKSDGNYRTAAFNQGSRKNKIHRRS